MWTICKFLPNFFFMFGKFPGTIDHLPIIPMGETSSFVKESDVISFLGCTEIPTIVP